MASRSERAFEDLDEEDDFEDLDDGEPDEDEDDDAAFAPLRPADTVQLLHEARQHAETRWLQADGRIAMPAGEMTCRVCGCTDNNGCPGGCIRAAPNLCSRCVFVSTTTRA